MSGLLHRNTSNPSQPGEQELIPQFIPSTLADVIGEDFHITEVTFCNVTASTVTVTVQDKQGTPVPLFASAPIGANSTYGAVFRGRLMPGGISWSASADNAISASIRGYK